MINCSGCGKGKIQKAYDQLYGKCNFVGVSIINVHRCLFRVMFHIPDGTDTYEGMLTPLTSRLRERFTFVRVMEEEPPVVHRFQRRFATSFVDSGPRWERTNERTNEKKRLPLTCVSIFHSSVTAINTNASYAGEKKGQGASEGAFEGVVLFRVHPEDDDEDDDRVT
ncbi:hypothetical protein RUM43_002852 [Polyplax serrata]|uniref:Uncharacterized protein n=1 Tax=Polyplax serrata TaxID=468196 RepID=A0AAN8P2P7_POLSC